MGGNHIISNKLKTIIHRSENPTFSYICFNFQLHGLCYPLLYMYILSLYIPPFIFVFILICFNILHHEKVLQYAIVSAENSSLSSLVYI